MAANTKTGQALVATVIEKYGSYEAYRQAMRERASNGGRNGNKKLNPDYSGGFAAKVPCSCSIIQGQHIKAQCLGSIGGARSKRRKKNA